MGSDDTTTTSMAPVVLVDDAHVGLIQFICQKMKTIYTRHPLKYDSVKYNKIF